MISDHGVGEDNGKTADSLGHGSHEQVAAKIPQRCLQGIAAPGGTRSRILLRGLVNQLIAAMQGKGVAGVHHDDPNQKGEGIGGCDGQDGKAGPADGSNHGWNESGHVLRILMGGCVCLGS